MGGLGFKVRRLKHSHSILVTIPMDPARPKSFVNGYFQLQILLLRSFPVRICIYANTRSLQAAAGLT